MTKKPHLLNWYSSCKEKKLGVSELGFFPHLMKPYLEKWCWRFTLEKELLRRGIIVGKFREEPGGWSSLTGKEGHGVNLWKVIRRG